MVICRICICLRTMYSCYHVPPTESQIKVDGRNRNWRCQLKTLRKQDQTAPASKINENLPRENKRQVGPD